MEIKEVQGTLIKDRSGNVYLSEVTGNYPDKSYVIPNEVTARMIDEARMLGNTSIELSDGSLLTIEKLNDPSVPYKKGYSNGVKDAVLIVPLVLTTAIVIKKWLAYKRSRKLIIINNRDYESNR